MKALGDTYSVVSSQVQLICSKLSLIRINWREVIRINEANITLKDKEEFRKQLNGKFINVFGAD
jgi:hypothetical protein